MAKIKKSPLNIQQYKHENDYQGMSRLHLIKNRGLNRGV